MDRHCSSQTKKSTWSGKQLTAKAGQSTKSFSAIASHGDSISMDHQWYEDESRKPTWTKNFPVVGQGIISFNIIRGTSFSIVIKPTGKPPSWQWMALEVYRKKIIFRLGKKPGEPRQLCICKEGEEAGFVENEKISYWVSFDRDRLVVKYGKGYFMEDTTIFAYNFLEKAGKDEGEQKRIRKEMAYLFNPIDRKLIEFYDCKPQEELTMHYAAAHLLLSKPMDQIDEIDFDEFLTDKKLTTSEGKEFYEKAKSIVDLESKVSFSRYPLVKNWAPLVLDSSKLSLFDLDQNQYIFSASLPPACQELYANVAGSDNIDLDWPPNTGQPKLSDAIRYSINTKGKILYEKLLKKATEFGSKPNEKETYLRVTLGVYRGNSPGIPYVLEIWPYQHYSPIHDHGNAYAIIKVVHGSLNVHIHNKNMMTEDEIEDPETQKKVKKPLKILTIAKGDVTWISPNWYQTHQLKNDTSGDYCATIQCYQYGNENDQHWPYFDYVSDQDQIEDFLPNSDFNFIQLREDLLKEYSAYLKGK